MIPPITEKVSSCIEIPNDPTIIPAKRKRKHPSIDPAQIPLKGPTLNHGFFCIVFPTFGDSGESKSQLLHLK